MGEAKMDEHEKAKIAGDAEKVISTAAFGVKMPRLKKARWRRTGCPA